MSGTTAITQTTAAYVCQTVGNGVTLQLNALDSIDPNNIADGAIAAVEVGDQVWKWYQTDGTAPGASVVAPQIPLVGTPALGRWHLQTGAVPPSVFYQFIENTPLNPAAAPTNLPDVSPAQAPTLRFQNMTSVGSGASETVITAFYQQVWYEDLIAATPESVMVQRPRLKFIQSNYLSATPGKILDVADIPAEEQTGVTLYLPPYHLVNGNCSGHLRFVGTPVTVYDDGTGNETVVTISAAASSAGWPAVLLVDNTSGGHNPTINGTDILIVQDTAYIHLVDSARILLATPGNEVYWAGSTGADGARITYNGAGSAPAGAPFSFSAPASSTGNAGAGVNIYAGGAASAGRATIGAGSAVTHATSGGGITFTTGNSTFANGGDYTVNAGVGDVYGGNIAHTAGNGRYGGQCLNKAGNGTLNGGDAILQSGNSTSYSGAYLYMYGGVESTGQIGWAELNSHLQLNNIQVPIGSPVNSGQLYSKLDGGVASLYWKTNGFEYKIKP